jgi:putative ABC transport system ATP-binding protein
MTAEPLVQLESVSREYRNGAAPVHALLDVTLALLAQELAVVHGRSGSGKTTLLNMIGGLERPTAGRVVVDGREVSALSEEALVGYRRESVGFVFQSFGLIPILTAAESGRAVAARGAGA